MCHIQQGTMRRKYAQDFGRRRRTRANQFSNQKKETVENAAQYIKEKVCDSRKKNEYVGSEGSNVTSILEYLLTLEQA